MKDEITFPMEDARALHNLLKIIENGAAARREAVPESITEEYIILSPRLGDTIALAYRLLGEKLEEADVDVDGSDGNGSSANENGYLQ